MKIVKVTYTVNSDFAEQNSANIKVVMDDLPQIKYEGIYYHACLSPDNKTFIHTAFFKSDEDQKLLNELASFMNFQRQLKNNGFEASPKQELLTLVGWSANIFND